MSEDGDFLDLLELPKLPKLPELSGFPVFPVFPGSLGGFVDVVFFFLLLFLLSSERALSFQYIGDLVLLRVMCLTPASLSLPLLAGSLGFFI